MTDDFRREHLRRACDGCTLHLTAGDSEFAGAGYAPHTPAWEFDARGGTHRAVAQHEWLLKASPGDPPRRATGWELRCGALVVDSGGLDGGPVEVGFLLTRPVRVVVTLEA